MNSSCVIFQGLICAARKKRNKQEDGSEEDIEKGEKPPTFSKNLCVESERNLGCEILFLMLQTSAS